MSRLIGIDIGGTKCAVSLGETEGETLRILAKKIFATPNRDPNAAIQKIISSIWELGSLRAKTDLTRRRYPQ